MKLFLAMALVFTSLTVTAKRKERVITEAPTAQFYFNKQIRFINLTNVCLNGDQLETLTEYSVCYEYKKKRDSQGRMKPSTECKVSGKQILTTSLEFKRNKCVDRNRRTKRCRKYEEKFYTYPTTFTKTVRKQRWVGNSNSGNWGYPGVVLSKEKYTIPACL